MNFAVSLYAMLLLCTSAAQTAPPMTLPESTPGISEAASDNNADTVSAKALLEKAFSCDLSDAIPTVQEERGQTELWFYPDSDQMMDNYYVQLDPDKSYPTMLYHFQHPNTDHIDIASDPMFVCDPALIETAQQYVQAVYGMDCTNSAVTVYGYQNKLAVQFKLAENCYFDVRFFYKDLTPTGILYLTTPEEASAWFNANNGKIFYTGNP